MQRLGDYIKEYSVRNKLDEEIPVYSVTNSNGFCRDYFGKEVASNNKRTYKVVPRNAFAYNPSRINVGSVDYQHYEDRVIVSPLYNVFTVDEKILPQYLYFYLKSPNTIKRIRTVASGSVRDNLKLSMLCEFPIQVPSINRQQNIIEILEKTQRIIDEKNDELEKLGNLIKARFVEMFENDNMNEKTIEDVASFCSRGKSPKYVTESKLKVINQACIYWDRFKFENVKYNEEDYDGDRIISNNDLLICSTGTGTLGRCNIFRVPDNSRYMADSHVTIIRLNGHILPEVFKAWFERPRTQEKLYSDCVSGSTNQIELSKEKLKNMNILVPPINLQKQFAAFVAQVDKSKFTLSNELAMCNFYVRLINDSITHSRIDLRMSE